MSEVRGRKTDDGGQKTEDRGRKTQDRGRKIEDEKMWEKEIDELKIRNLVIGKVRAEIGL